MNPVNKLGVVIIFICFILLIIHLNFFLLVLYSARLNHDVNMKKKKERNLVVFRNYSSRRYAISLICFACSMCCL
jgi:hypothetical protein